MARAADETGLHNVGYALLKAKSMPGQSDHSAAEIRSLVERCLADDASAIGELVELYRGPVFGLCYRMLGQRQDAEDAAQEVFARAIRSLGRWDGQRDFSPWLMAIAGNRCRTWLAARSRRPQPIGEVDHLPDQRPAADAARNLAEELAMALDQIRVEYRQAFLLFHEQELSYAQIAAALDCPIGTVKTWVHRARRDLVRRLLERGAVQEPSSVLRRV